MFDKMAAIGHFGCPKFTFDRIYDHFRSIGHFGCLKFTFDRISGHFRSIHNFLFLKLLTKWLPSATLDVRNSLSIAFLVISDRYATLHYFFYKMAAVGHFGCPKFTFDRISGHFRSIGHFGCLKFTFDGISGHFSSIRSFFFLDKMAAGSPIRAFDRISGLFRSIHNFFFDKMAAGGHFGWDENVNYRTHPRYLDE